MKDSYGKIYLSVIVVLVLGLIGVTGLSFYQHHKIKKYDELWPQAYKVKEFFPNGDFIMIDYCAKVSCNYVKNQNGMLCSGFNDKDTLDLIITDVFYNKVSVSELCEMRGVNKNDDTVPPIEGATVSNTRNPLEKN